MEKLTKLFGEILLGTLSGLFLDLILAWLFMIIWNECIPCTIDGAHTIPYWDAFGILVLVQILKVALASNTYGK